MNYKRSVTEPFRLQFLTLDVACGSTRHLPLIEVMADERWKRLAQQQGVAYAKTVAEAMDLNLNADNPADREKLRRAVLDLVAGKKCQSKKGLVEFLSFSF